MKKIIRKIIARFIRLNLRSRSDFEKYYGFDVESLVGQKVLFGEHAYLLKSALKAKEGRRGYTIEAFCPEAEQRVCCKIYFKEMLKGNPKWKQEYTKPNRVRSENIAYYITDREFDFNGISFIGILFEWIEGSNLKEYVDSNPDKLNMPFIMNLAEWILHPLHDLKRSNDQHGDLHMGNIMVKVSDENDITPNEVHFKLIDFGISSIENLPPRDDYESVAIILAELLKRIDEGKLNFEERFLFDCLCRQYLKLLQEAEVKREEAVKNPKILLQELRRMQDEAKKIPLMIGGKDEKLSTPFELLSADKFRDDSLLLRKLFSKAIPGYELLESQETVLITGPRGCGKTMVLRNMALKTYLADEEIKLSELPSYFGFYLSAFELSTAFPRRRLDEQKSPEEIATDAFQKRTLHFFHLCLLEEIFSTIEQLVKRFGVDIAPDSCLEKVAEFINSNFRSYKIPPEGKIVSDLRAISEKWRSDYKKKQPLEIIEEGPAFLRDLCKCLKENVPLFNKRSMFFLIDDYSLNKVTPALQLSLNRVIFQRVPEFVFKLSSEKEALILRDVDAALDASRTHRELDLGYLFTSADSTDQRLKLLKEVFDNRLKYTEGVKHLSIEKILGQTKYTSFNQFAEVLSNKYTATKEDSIILKKPLYHGLDHLAEIYSGDVAAIISLVNNILIESKFDLKADSVSEVGPVEQDKAIKDYSRSFLEQVGGGQKESERCRIIAKMFGEMAQWKLMNQTSGNEGRNPPFQVCRLEVYEDAAIQENLKPIFTYLLRYGIFIQEHRGFGQGENLSKRLYFRRLFLPSFGLSFSRRDCIRLHMNDFNKFLDDPQRTKEEKIKEWQRKKEINEREARTGEGVRDFFQGEQNGFD